MALEISDERLAVMIGPIMGVAIAVLSAGTASLVVNWLAGLTRKDRYPLSRLQIVIVLVLIFLIVFGTNQYGPDSVIDWLIFLVIGMTVWVCVSGMSWLARRIQQNRNS